MRANAGNLDMLLVDLEKGRGVIVMGGEGWEGGEEVDKLMRGVEQVV